MGWVSEWVGGAAMVLCVGMATSAKTLAPSPPARLPASQSVTTNRQGPAATVGSIRTLKVFDAPGRCGVQVEELLHLACGQHLILPWREAPEAVDQEGGRTSQQ